MMRVLEREPEVVGLELEEVRKSTRAEVAAERLLASAGKIVGGGNGAVYGMRGMEGIGAAKERNLLDPRADQRQTANI